MATAVAPTYDPTHFPLLASLDPSFLADYNSVILAGPFAITGESSLRNLANAANLEPFEAFTVLKKEGGVSLSPLEQEIYQSVVSKQTASPKYSGLTNNVQSFDWFRHYYGEHPVGSHYAGDFNISRAIGEIVTVLTFGTIDLSKLSLDSNFFKSMSVNIPGSGKGLRAYGGAEANLVTAQQFDTEIEGLDKNPYIRLGASVLGATGVAIAAAPIAGTIIGASGFGASEGAGVAVSEQSVGGYVGTADAFGTVANPAIGATLDVGQLTGPSALESSLFGTPFEGTLATALAPSTQLGLSTTQLFAPAAVSPWGQVGKVGSSLTQGAGLNQVTQTLWTQLTTGDFSGLGNTVLGLLGLPGLVPQKQPGAPQFVAGGVGGGGAGGPFLTVANPAGVSLVQYAIGAGLLLGIGWLILRKG